MGAHVWSFLPVAVVLIIAPGPDTAVVTRNAVVHGRRAGLATALGVTAGLMIWTVAAAAGVAALVRASEVAFTVLKLVGAAYLLWLGVRALWTAGRHIPAAGAAAPARPLRDIAGVRQGTFSDLSNPKIGILFTALLPQFVNAGAPVVAPFLLLGGLFAAMTLLWLGGYALVAARASRALRRPAVARAIDRVTGLVLIGFGVRLATLSRA